MNKKLKEQHLFKIEVFSNNISLYYNFFYPFNISLLNKSINFFKKKKYWPQTFE